MPKEKQVEIRKLRFGLRLKLTVGLVLIIGIIIAAQNIFTALTQKKAMRAEVMLSSATVARVVLASLTDKLPHTDIDDPSLKLFVNNFMSVAIITNPNNKDMVFGIVIDTKGRVVAGRARTKQTLFQGKKRYKTESRVLKEIARLKGNLGHPIKTIRYNLQVKGKGDVGKLYVGTSLARVERNEKRALMINGAVFLGTLLLLFAYSALALGRMVTHPITLVMNAMRAVHAGNLNEEIEISSQDEMGVLADTYNFMVSGLREREQLQDAFSRYVSTQVYDKLQQGEITLTGETRNATILFSDIRAFTAMSERLPPHEVVRLLNEYFNVMVEIVFKNEGFLNKFMGDALMAIYNVPIDQTEPELRAVKTALEMASALIELNRRRAERGLFAIKIGIGINTGPVTAGNIGHMRRLEYTVIGDAVNLAQRIESQTKVTGMPILISATTYEAVAQHIVAQALPPVKVKGKQEPVALYAVTAMRDQAQAASTAPAAPIPVPQEAPPAAAPSAAAPPAAAPPAAAPSAAAPPAAAPSAAAPPPNKEGS